MKKLLLSAFCSVFFVIALGLQAEARIVVGTTATSAISSTNSLASSLNNLSDEDVKLRQFDSDAALTNWLLRFREIDAAIVPASFLAAQPAGTLHQLADLHRTSGKPLALVVRSDMPQDQSGRLKEAFIKLGSIESGRQALAANGLTGVTLPGKEPKQQVTSSKPTKTPSVEKAPTRPTVKTSPVKVVQQETVKESPAGKTLPPAQPAPKKAAPTTRTEVKPPQTTAQETEPAKKPAKGITVKTEQKKKAEIPKATEQQQPEPAAKDKPVEHPERVVTKQPEPEKQVAPQQPIADKQVQQAKTQPKAEVPKQKSDQRLIIFVVLVICAAILLKIVLIAMRWQHRKQSTSKPAPTSTIAEELLKAPPTETASPATAAAAEELIIETGHLGPGKVPALLKRCADLPEPVVLQVTKGSCEKLVYFAAGQVSGALTQNASAQESGVRWSKLGSMLLREEFITEEQRDEGMALLIKEPGLRFGEALLKLGHITLAELRHALTRQAKTTIYSLILFPEGRYKVFAERGALPPEESVALEVTNLIREASQHQSEWMAIREALPNLNTSLDFTPEGRSKLTQVNISPQQEATLGLIDGKRSINELCVESTMMDYEVYRFLYLMVKAGVLNQPG